MTVPSLWQVAAGLGVGAFVAALFYGVVRHFGRRKGEGFETSKLGKEATAIIAVLIVLIAGGATITALVLYVPRDAPLSASHVLPPEALRAKEGWAAGTTVILSTWRDQASRYAELLAEQLSIPLAELKEMDASTRERARVLHLAVFNKLEVTLQPPAMQSPSQNVKIGKLAPLALRWYAIGHAAREGEIG